MPITVLLDDETADTAPLPSIRLVEAEPAGVKRLSAEDEVRQWLDDVALCFGLYAGGKRRQWMDV